MSDSSDLKDDVPSDAVSAMQSNLEHNLEDLIMECFTDEFPEDPENAKYILSSLYHVCGHLAAKNGICVPDLMGIVCHESMEAQSCVVQATMQALMHVTALPMDPDDPKKDVN